MGEEVARLNQRLARLRTTGNSAFLLDYVHKFLRAPRTRRRIFDEAQGAAQPNISHKAIAAFELPLIPINEQEQFNSNFESQELHVKRIESSLEAAIAKVSLLKRSTLKSAFSGELV
jgi:type I restriction enzyme, S subunit